MQAKLPVLLEIRSSAFKVGNLLAFLIRVRGDMLVHGVNHQTKKQESKHTQVTQKAVQPVTEKGLQPVTGKTP